MAKLENENNVYVTENQKFKTMLEEMKAMQDTINVENETLKNCIAENEKHIAALDKARNDYITENEKLQGINKENTEQLHVLQSQVDKLKELYNNSRELLLNLANAGDLFNKFSNTISTNFIKINDTADHLGETQDEFEVTLNEMKNLVNKLKDETFNDLDVDGDGTITKEEFENGIKITKKK